jgi:beta-lactamase class A
MILATVVLAALSFQQKSDAHESFPMASVFKFPVVLAALRRVDTGTLSLKQQVTIEPKDFSPGWSPLRDRANGKPVTLTVRDCRMRATSCSRAA